MSLKSIKAILNLGVCKFWISRIFKQLASSLGKFVIFTLLLVLIHPKKKINNDTWLIPSFIFGFNKQSNIIIQSEYICLACYTVSKINILYTMYNTSRLFDSTEVDECL